MASSSARARERAEARRREIAERQAKEARRRLLLRILLPVAVVVLVVAVFLVVKIAGGGGGDDAAPGVIASGAAPASLVQQVTTIPADTYDAAGSDGDVRGPTALSGDPLTADGKPRVLYVGAEFCPFCAAERWVVVTSLARFGTFEGLGQTNSSPDDVHPNTATLTFHGATYTSNYLSFTGDETTDVDHQPLDALSAADEAIVKALNPEGTIPFQDLGGEFQQSGASFDPSLLAAKTHAQIAAAITDPTTAIGKAVLAAANLYTAALCKLTDGQPGDVCSSSAVTAAAGKLGS